MGVLKGSVTVETSEEQLVFSEDSKVVAGEARAGCGWVPADEVDEVKAGADVITSRTVTHDQRTHYRDIYARRGPASANLYVAKATITKCENVGRTAKPLKGPKLTEWVEAVARQNPVAIDLYVDRVLARASGRDMVELYPAFRALLGAPPFDDTATDEPDEGTGLAPGEAGAAANKSGSADT